MEDSYESIDALEVLEHVESLLCSIRKLAAKPATEEEEDDDDADEDPMARADKVIDDRNIMESVANDYSGETNKVSRKPGKRSLATLRIKMVR